MILNEYQWNYYVEIPDEVSGGNTLIYYHDLDYRYGEKMGVCFYDCHSDTIIFVLLLALNNNHPCASYMSNQ